MPRIRNKNLDPYRYVWRPRTKERRVRFENAFDREREKQEKLSINEYINQIIDKELCQKK